MLFRRAFFYWQYHTLDGKIPLFLSLVRQKSLQFSRAQLPLVQKLGHVKYFSTTSFGPLKLKKIQLTLILILNHRKLELQSVTV